MTDDGFASYQQQEARRRALAAKLRLAAKARLFHALAPAGIASVTVLFDGEGDTGQIVDVSAYTSDSKPVPLPGQRLSVQTAKFDGSGAEEATLPINEAITSLCYEPIEDKHEGWEINEGSYGEFAFDVAGDTIELTFNERIADINTSIHTY